LFQSEVGEIVVKSSREARREGKIILDLFQISTSNPMAILQQVMYVLTSSAITPSSSPPDISFQQCWGSGIIIPDPNFPFRIPDLGLHVHS
jgi:hypothetical protein